MQSVLLAVSLLHRAHSGVISGLYWALANNKDKEEMQLLEKKIAAGISILIAPSQGTWQNPLCLSPSFSEPIKLFALAARKCRVILCWLYLPSRQPGMQEACSSCPVVLYKHQAGGGWHPVSPMSSIMAGAAAFPPPGVLLWVSYSHKHGLSHCAEVLFPAGCSLPVSAGARELAPR